jgi:hypothetical protein
VALFNQLKESPSFPCIPLDWTAIVMEGFELLNTHKQRELEYGDLEKTKMEVVTWLIRFLGDKDIIIPEVKLQMLRLVEELSNFRCYIRAFEKIPLSATKLVPYMCSLIRSGERKEWSASVGFLRISYGVGIGEKEMLAEPGRSVTNLASPHLCNALKLHILEGAEGGRFVHDLLNRTNWYDSF